MLENRDKTANHIWETGTGESEYLALLDKWDKMKISTFQFCTILDFILVFHCILEDTILIFNFTNFIWQLFQLLITLQH